MGESIEIVRPTLREQIVICAEILAVMVITFPPIFNAADWLRSFP